VVDVGPDVKRCKKGDQIAFNSSTEAAKMELGGKTYVVMTEKDIVGVIV
jgi:co-chaperonin GroES (HSP10)